MNKKSKFILILMLIMLCVGSIAFFSSCDSSTPIYSIYFMDGNEIVAAARTTSNKVVKLPNAKEVDGKLFYGWFINRNSSSSDYEFTENYLLTHTIEQDYYVYAFYVDLDTEIYPAICTVTYDYNNQFSEVKEKTDNLKFRSLIQEPVDPIVPGFIFNGWYKDEACTQAWDFEFARVRGNITLYASWIINYYTIEYDLNGGDCLTALQNKFNAEIPLVVSDPTKKGYEFDKWYLDNDYLEEYNSEVVYSENLHLYAKWIPKTYTIMEYVLGDGELPLDTVNPTSYNFDDGLEITSPISTREGYSFYNWYYTIDDENRLYIDSENLPDLDGIVLTAEYREIEYKIVYHLDGDVVNTNPSSYKYFDDESEFILNVPQRAWYSFDGWFLDELLTTKFTSINSDNSARTDLDLYAAWTENVYNLRFEENGANSIDDLTFSISNLPQNLETPTKDSYVFIGWFFDVNFESRFATNLLQAKDTTVYARFVKESELDEANFYTYEDISDVEYVVNQTKSIALYIDNDLISVKNEDITGNDWIYVTERNLLLIRKSFLDKYKTGHVLQLDLKYNDGSFDSSFISVHAYDVYDLITASNSYVKDSQTGLEIGFANQAGVVNSQNRLIVNSLYLNNNLVEESNYSNSNSDVSSITIFSKFLDQLQPGNYKLELYSNRGISIANITIFASSQGIPYNLYIDYDKIGTTNSYIVSDLNWDIDMAVGSVDYYSVVIGERTFTETNPKHTHLFSDNSFAASGYISNGDSIRVIATIGGVNYTSEPIVVSMPDLNKKQYIMKNYEFLGEQFNTYISSYEEFVDLVDFMILRYATLEYATQVQFSTFKTVDIFLDFDANSTGIDYENDDVFDDVSVYDINNISFVKDLFGYVLKGYSEAFVYRYTCGRYTDNEFMLLLEMATKLEASDSYEPNSVYVEETKTITHFGAGLADDYVFSIDKSAKTSMAYSTDELVKLLESNVKPMFESGSIVETVYNNMRAVLRKIIDENQNDYEKVIAINEWLAKNVIYDYETLEKVTNNEFADYSYYNYPCFYVDSIFNPISEKRISVCNGITKAFSMMCNTIGIQCYKVNGNHVSGDSSVGHAWNKVRINNKWYVCDPTFSNKTSSVLSGDVEYVSNYYMFMTQQQAEATGHIENASEYSDIYANDTQYNVFANISIYDMNSIKQDYVISSYAEIYAMIDFYLYNLSSKMESGSRISFEYYLDMSNLDSIVLGRNYSGYTFFNVTTNGGPSNISNKYYELIIKKD